MRNRAVFLILAAAAAVTASGAGWCFEITPGNAVALIDGKMKTTIKTAFDSFVPRSVMKSGNWRPELAVSYADTILVVPKTHGDDDEGPIYYISLAGGAKGSDVARVEVVVSKVDGARKVVDVIPLDAGGKAIPVFANGSGMFSCKIVRVGGTEAWDCVGEYPSREGKIIRRLVYVSSPDGKTEIPWRCEEIPGATLITALSAGQKALACGYVRIEEQK